ncbi:Acetyl-coenzyme A synthetase [Dermatophilus congolensis]|uniref:acetate--CoA ligase n=1 Tax=Dermatophilus congolensis TaxID=1863 RepID=A0AA46BQJ5_9MICO|nr:hypothetical protein [Dermatophilus congolensis]STD15764.1 Acetyl-coenzyme A synthetase [Dermatophilus congolensis]
MAREIWGDTQRCIDTYRSRLEGMYFAADGAKKNTNANIWILGRVDDVMNISGHRLSTSEIESALVSHDAVGPKTAVFGATNKMTGKAVATFVILRARVDGPDEKSLVEELRDVAEKPRSQ